jgi:hypothetical protein
MKKKKKKKDNLKKRKKKKKKKKGLMQPLSIEPVTSKDKCRVVLTKTE